MTPGPVWEVVGMGGAGDSDPRASVGGCGEGDGTSASDPTQSVSAHTDGAGLSCGQAVMGWL